MLAARMEVFMPTQPPKPSDLSDGVTNHNEAYADHERASLGDARADARSGARRTDGGRRGDQKDAPPSNTASSNSNGGYFKALRWGVDSLYLSYTGELHPTMNEKLQNLKSIAQSPEAYQRVTAQLELDGHIFEVKDKGAPLFPFILEDNAYRIQVSRSSGRVPLAYVKLSSEYLSHVLSKEAEESLRRVVALLGEITESANVSRIDLFVDFVSSENMESWDRHAWVTRARSVNAYSVDGKFSGWSVGLGGIISARLYDKTLEIQKSKKTYLHDLWMSSGWDGISSVWRLEFELKREVLTEHGLSKLDDVLRNLNGLWSYATTDWLRLTLPNADDQTRSRWPIHPLWGYLSSVDWEASGGVLSKRFSNTRVPSDDKMFSLAFSMIVNYMARKGIRDMYDGLKEFEAAMYSYHERKSFYMGLPFDNYVAERVSIKAREFNTMLNPKPDEDDAQAAIDRNADAYRRASKGG
jgi:hypothetical protein